MDPDPDSKPDPEDPWFRIRNTGFHLCQAICWLDTESAAYNITTTTRKLTLTTQTLQREPQQQKAEIVVKLVMMMLGKCGRSAGTSLEFLQK